jgi:hypothetical protein
MPSLRFMDRRPQSAGVGKAICLFWAGPSPSIYVKERMEQLQLLRFIVPRRQSAGVARGVCLQVAELILKHCAS